LKTEKNFIQFQLHQYGYNVQPASDYMISAKHATLGFSQVNHRAFYKAINTKKIYIYSV